MVRILLFVFALLLACNNEHLHEQDNTQIHDEESEHEHDEISFKTTLINDSLEFFIEYTPLIVEESSDFLVHISKLQGYIPIKGGQLSVEIGKISKTALSPIRDGIYKINLIPQSAGNHAITYSLKIGSQKIEIIDTVEIFEDHEAVHELEHSEPLGAINYTKEQAWENEFGIEQVKKAPFHSIITTSGEMLAMPGEKQNIVSKSHGIILFASKKMVQGTRVVQGQLMFTISGQDIADENIGLHFAETKNRYHQSKSEYKRHKLLFKDKIISEKQFIETETRYKTDSIAFFSLSKSVNANGQRIYAPLTGYIHTLNVSEGQYVETGQLLVTISTNKTMLLRADLPQQYFEKLNLIQSANFRTAYSTKTYRLEELDGQIIAKGASVAENNHYMPVYFKVENDGSLLEGAFAEFSLITGSKEDLISVPNSSIMEEQGLYYVFVQHDGEMYIKTPITIGDSDGLRTAVLTGLNSGDIVVTNGVIFIKIASAGASMPVHNHAH